MTRILLTGAGGQLGSAIRQAAEGAEVELIPLSSQEINLAADNLLHQLQDYPFDVLINCAAYTAVDKAESEKAVAEKINQEALKYLAAACKRKNAVLIHISTDYVYADKCPAAPLQETDATEPTSVYGRTKLAGEQAALKEWNKTLVVRTSWLYGRHGHNFVSSMLRLGAGGGQLNIVYDQVGTPTNAADLAKALLVIAEKSRAKEFNDFGIYNYSNEGVSSWYDFACEIFSLRNMKVQTAPILTKDYPTPAKRPHYSVLDKQKIKSTFGIRIPHWRDSLKDFLSGYKAGEGE